MKPLLHLVIFLFSMSAIAQSEVASKTVLKYSNSTSTNGFHWLTRKCDAEESGEIESTPGSPPLEIDDPATPGCNKWEFNVVFNGDFTRDEKSLQLPLLDINYGIGDNLQLKYEIPNVVSESADSSTRVIGNSKAGVKFQFYGNDETKFQMSVYPQVEFFAQGLSSGDQAPDSSGNIITLPVLLAKRLAQFSRGDVMMSANLGYSLSTRPDTSNFISSAIAIGAPLVGKISILSELTTTQAISKIQDELREERVKFNLGLMSPIGKSFAVFGSVGKSLIASDKRDHTYALVGFRTLVGK